MRSDKWFGFGVLRDDPEEATQGLKQMRQEMRDGFDDRIERLMES